MYKYQIITRRGKILIRTNDSREASKVWEKAKNSSEGAVLYSAPKIRTAA